MRAEPVAAPDRPRDRRLSNVPRLSRVRRLLSVGIRIGMKPEPRTCRGWIETVLGAGIVVRLGAVSTPTLTAGTRCVAATGVFGACHGTQGLETRQRFSSVLSGPSETAISKTVREISLPRQEEY